MAKEENRIKIDNAVIEKGGHISSNITINDLPLPKTMPTKPATPPQQPQAPQTAPPTATPINEN